MKGGIKTKAGKDRIVPIHSRIEYVGDVRHPTPLALDSRGG
jgi:hypothetical protein